MDKVTFASLEIGSRFQYPWNKLESFEKSGKALAKGADGKEFKCTGAVKVLKIAA